MINIRENRKCTNQELASSSYQKNYDYLLKFLLVGDSDVGKNEILSLLDDGTHDSPYTTISGVSSKTTSILLDGRCVKLELWDTSGQGRFNTIIRSYSRGAQGVLLVYDITNRWSFGGIDRWLKEIEQQAPGIPKILIGNRLHLEFRRAVPRSVAETYATKNNMEYFEVSPLADFNIHESLAELSRLVLQRNGMQRLLKPTKVLCLQEITCRCIIKNLRTIYAIDQLPLPPALRLTLRSFANSALLTASNTLPIPHKHKHSRTPSDIVSSVSSPVIARSAANNRPYSVKQSCKRIIAFCGGPSPPGRRTARALSDESSSATRSRSANSSNSAAFDSRHSTSSVVLRPQAVSNDTTDDATPRRHRHTLSYIGSSNGDDPRRNCKLM